MTESRGQRRAIRQHPLAAMLLLLWLAVSLVPGPAGAQLFNFSDLLGKPEQSAPEQKAPARPLQSLPVTSPSATPQPDPQDYARIAQTEIADEASLMLGSADTYVRVFRKRLVAIFQRAPDAFGEIDAALSSASPTGRPIYFLGIGVFAALLLVVGRALAEIYYVYLARPVFVRMQRPNPQGYVDKLPVLAYRLLLSVVGLVLILTVAGLVGVVFYEEHRPTVLTALIVFALYTALTLVNTLWRMILAPYLPEYRLPPLTDGEARQFYLWANGASIFGMVSAAFCYWVYGLGLAHEVHVLVTLLLTAITVGLLLATMRANATAIRRIILGGRAPAEASWITRAAAAAFAPVASLYFVFSWGDLAFRMVMGIGGGPGRVLVPYLVLIAGILIYGVIMYAIERVFARQRRMRAMNRAAEERRRAEEEAEQTARMAAIRDEAFFSDGGDTDGDGEDEGGMRVVADHPARAEAAAVEEPAEPLPPPRDPRGGMRTMEDLARRVASILAIGIAAYALARYWGGPELFAETAIFGIAEDLVDILLIGYIVFHATRIWLDQKIEEEGGDELPAGPMDGEGGGAGASRLATLLPLVRNSILAVIAVTVALVVAMELGVNVAPLFAGAGIVGIAIGFGAQALVRDIISGAFFLIDDAFRKGEYIDVGDVKGTVEKISIRSFQLRHHLGALHTIPFGEIKSLTNFSRDWVMMKLPLRLTYDTDVERVRKLIKKLGQELLEDPVVGDKFLQPLKSQGVIQMEDSAMIVRVKFMTRPGDQWVVRKRVYQEIRELFAREGIHFAHREVTVRIPGLPEGAELDPETRRAAGAAARTAVDVIEAEAMPATGTHGRIDDR